MMRRLFGVCVVALCLSAQAMAADVKAFMVIGGAGKSAYAGTVRVTTLPASDASTLFMSVEWTFGTYVIKGYGVIAKDDPTLLTISYVVPLGLGVGRYKIQDYGGVVGTLVGEKGVFVEEVWTPTDGPAAMAPPAAGDPANPHASTSK